MSENNKPTLCWLLGFCCLNILPASVSEASILCPKKKFWKFFTLILPRRINTVKTDWEMSTAYIFRLKHDTTAVSIFSVPFWLFHLGGCKNPPSWNSRLPGTARAACSTVILLKCYVIAWSPFLCCLVPHFFHFISFISPPLCQRSSSLIHFLVFFFHSLLTASC